MAFITIAHFRQVTGVDATAMPDASVGMFIGAASAMVYGLTGRMFGHYSESLTQNGGDVDVVVYGHMLLPAGQVMVGLSGNDDFDGIYAYVRINENAIRLLDAILTPSIESIKIFPRFTQDLNIRECRVRPSPTPVLSIEEIRVDETFSGGARVPFDIDTVVEDGDYYVAEDGDSSYNSEIELVSRYGGQVKRRVRGYINPIRTSTRRIARVTFFAGTLRDLNLDLLVAIAAIAGQIATDPGGELSSESLDYYSYTRRSLQESMSYPSAAMATILRYKVML